MKSSDTTTKLNSVIDKTTRKISVINLNDKQENALKSAGLGLGGIFTGAALFGVLNPAKGEPVATEITLDASDTDLTHDSFVGPIQPADLDKESLTNLEIEQDLIISATDYNDLSFDQAFASARKDLGSGEAFLWNGDVYNTYYAEEWNEMTEEAQEEFLATVDLNTTIEEELDVTNIDIDNDGVAEIMLEDIDNDGVLDVKSVDLNNDGNLDVIHGVATNPDNTMTSQEADTEEIVEAELLDEVDLELQEADPIAEVKPKAEVELESSEERIINLEEIPETDVAAVQEADDAELDIIIVDEGIEEIVVVEESDEVLQMDEYEIVPEEDLEGSEGFDELDDLFEGDGILPFSPDEI